MVNHPNRRVTGKRIADRLIVALSLALDELHHPGAARAAGVNLLAMCEAVLAEATATPGFHHIVRDTMAEMAAANTPPTSDN